MTVHDLYSGLAMKIFGLPMSLSQKILYAVHIVFLITINIAASTEANGGEEYGDVTGRIILQGEIPKLRPLLGPGDNNKARDAALCGALDIPNDSLVIHRKNRGIQNVLVYLRKAPKEAIHPVIEKRKNQMLKVSLKNCRFHPYTMVVRNDQEVVIEQGGATGHNVHTYPIFNRGFITLVRPGKPGLPIKLQPFKLKEPLPMQVKCDIHAWMQAYWLVLDHPYAATTDANGRFTIDKLPEGEHSLTIWHERVGYIEKAYKIDVSKDKRVDLVVYEVPLDRFEIRDDELRE